jgi:hypothetical protein
MKLKPQRTIVDISWQNIYYIIKTTTFQRWRFIPLKLRQRNGVDLSRVACRTL